MTGLALLAIDLVVIAAFTSSKVTLIVAVIVSGAFVGLNNTLTTQAVMLVAPVEKPVASAAYGFVRFIGGGLAPYAAGRLVIAVNIHFPFFIAVGAIVAGIAILSTARSLLTEAERVQAEQVSAATSPDATRGVILAAVDNSPMADLVTETAARLAAADGRAVYVVHAQEDVTASDVATDGEDLEDSRTLVRKQLDLLAAHGMEPKDFTPLAFSKAHYNGQLLCIPLDTHPFVQYYNTKVCKKAGLLDSSGRWQATVVRMDGRRIDMLELTELGTHAETIAEH